jgi:AbrB family looped-hinge helix DNA binding protein
MPVVRIRTNRQVTIPKKVFDDVGLREGDFVEVVRLENAVLIKPKKLVDPEDTLTPEEEKIVEKGFEDLKQGKSIPWSKAKHELGL